MLSYYLSVFCFSFFSDRVSAFCDPSVFSDVYDYCRDKHAGVQQSDRSDGRFNGHVGHGRHAFDFLLEIVFENKLQLARQVRRR